MRPSGSSYFTPIEPTSQAKGSGVTAPWPVRGLDVGGQVVEQREQVLAQRGHLLLLAPQVDEATLVAPGEEEDTLARRAVGAGPEHLGAREVVGLAHVHEGTSGPVAPVSLTVSTVGPSSP